MEFTCTKCNNHTKIDTAIEVKNFGCPNCGSLFDFDEKGFRFSKKFDYNPITNLLKIGAKGVIDNETYEIVGLVIKRVHSIYYWREYTLMTTSGKVKYLSESDGHWILLEEVPESYDVSRKYKKLTHKEITYHLYEHTNSSIVRVHGFYEFEIPNKQFKIIEYINPPYVISIEQIKDNETTTFGRHITSKEIKKIFNSNEMPQKSGVGLVQPFLFNIYNTIIIFISFAILILTTFIIFNLSRTEQNVLNVSINFDEYKSKEYISPSFELKGSPAPLIISANTSVDNSWANAQVSLVNESNNEEEYAQKDIEYYHGYSEGERWSEGSKRTTFNFCGVAKGKYHLVIVPSKQETDFYNQNMTINAVWNESSVWNFMFSLVSLAIIFILIFFLKKNFEQRRWENSDFTPY
ncbi:DUF4178 domain-containing protein [Flavobacterium sp.]|jgi:hypothetical protein|uniref:DUF4178 domain-containing protein n=1 Tax=Flavobacterium sp. TaxID=239 RepID=UPI0037BF12B4